MIPCNTVSVSGRIYTRIKSGRWKYLRKRATAYSWVFPGSQLHKTLDACADLQSQLYTLRGPLEVQT